MLALLLIETSGLEGLVSVGLEVDGDEPGVGGGTRSFWF